MKQSVLVLVLALVLVSACEKSPDAPHQKAAIEKLVTVKVVRVVSAIPNILV